MFTDYIARDADLARDRDHMVRDRIRRPDGTPFNLWHADTDIPDPAVFYPTCFAVPFGDRTLLHFQTDGELSPMLFSYLRVNRGRDAPARFVLHGLVNPAPAPASSCASAATAITAATDTVLTGVFVKSTKTFVVDDVLVARGVVCCHHRPARPIASRARELFTAVRDAQQIPHRWFGVVAQSHRRAPLEAVQRAAAGGTVKQWLPDAWVPEKYAVKVYQLRDVHSVRPFLNLRTSNWSDTWNAPVIVAGSGVAALEEDEDEDDEDSADEDDATNKKKKRRRLVWTPMELDPRRRGGDALGALLVQRCPVYRRSAVFAVQANTVMADIYRLFCFSGRSRQGLQADIVAHNNRTEDEDEDDAKNSENTLVRSQLRFYQYALVPSFDLSVRLNVWFRHVPEQERLAWTVTGAPSASAAMPPELRNETGRRILLMECVFDVDRCRWIPQNLVPFRRADELVREATLILD